MKCSKFYSLWTPLFFVLDNFILQPKWVFKRQVIIFPKILNVSAVQDVRHPVSYRKQLTRCLGNNKLNVTQYKECNIPAPLPTSKHNSFHIQSCNFYVLCGFHSLHFNLRHSSGLKSTQNFKPAKIWLSCLILLLQSLIT